MDIELEKLKKLEHALCDAIDILRDWQVEEVKQECPCADGIDSKACVGCEHSEDGKKKYRPYESPAEMIVDFIDRFKVKCPSYCEPLIWVKNKWSGGRFLITGIESSPYDGENVEVQCGLHCVSGLFDTYTYLDGSPCGMEVKE